MSTLLTPVRSPIPILLLLSPRPDRQEIDKLPENKNAKLVLYCSSGHMSTIASDTLVRLGYASVFGLPDG